MNHGEKYLINCQNGANNVERATVSFILAVTASKTAETAVFLSAEASRLCTRGGTDNLVAEGYESLKSLIGDFVANGGRIWLCPACAKAKNIVAEDLIDGAEIAGAPKTMAFLASGAQMLA